MKETGIESIKRHIKWLTNRVNIAEHEAEEAQKALDRALERIQEAKDERDAYQELLDLHQRQQIEAD